MFTGIIEEIGVLTRVEKSAKSTRLTIQATKVLEGLKYGDSIATDGVCLTVAGIQDNIFIADVMSQTLDNSTLGSLQINSKVNLERALQLNTRLGGHIVSGHIDCIGEIVSIKNDDIARWVEISPAQDYMRYLVEKGSVCVDGISLTIAKIGESKFSVSTIPVTQIDTTLAQKKIGDKVNLEMDVLIKYTEHLLNFNNKKDTKSNIDMDFLRENGFL